MDSKISQKICEKTLLGLLAWMGLWVDRDLCFNLKASADFFKRIEISIY